MWKRTKWVATDDDLRRIERLARMRFHHDHLDGHEVMVLADELEIPLLPKGGAAGMPQGPQEAIMTPGTNEKYYLAGALQLATGKMPSCLGPRKNPAVFRNLLPLLDTPSPAPAVTGSYVVVDNYCIHKAKAVEQLTAVYRLNPVAPLSPVYSEKNREF